jgi:hypothetical protein
MMKQIADEVDGGAPGDRAELVREVRPISLGGRSADVEDESYRCTSAENGCTCRG